MQLTSIGFYRVLAVLTMGNFFLPIVFGNIFFPFSHTLFYLFAWIVSLLVLFPRVYRTKAFLPVYFFAILYVLFLESGIFSGRDDFSSFAWVRRELQALFLSFLMLAYFVTSRDIKGLKLTMRYVVFFVFTTLITSYIGLQTYPSASRDLAGALARDGEFELISYYRSIGIGGYDFFYGLAFAVPAFVAFTKCKATSTQFKILVFLFTLFSIYGIITAQFTTALLFAIIGALLAFFVKDQIKTTLITLGLFVVLFIAIPDELIADLIMYFSETVGDGVLQARLIDLSVTAQEGIGAEGTHIDMRYSRIPYLLNSFWGSPFVGGGVSLGHNWWFDRLSMFGLVGTLPWVWIIWRQIKYNKSIISKSNFKYYLITMVLFIAMGLMKNMGQTGSMVFVFFIVPSLLIVKSHYYDNKITKQNAQ